MMKQYHSETAPSLLQDQYGRIKRKLRISVTDRCNFKCVYCMPEHPEWLNKQDLLSFEALFNFVILWCSKVSKVFALRVVNH